MGTRTSGEGVDGFGHDAALTGFKPLCSLPLLGFGLQLVVCLQSLFLFLVRLEQNKHQNFTGTHSRVQKTPHHHCRDEAVTRSSPTAVKDHLGVWVYVCFL